MGVAAESEPKVIMGVVVPQAEGQQRAGLLVELEVDALQLSRAHQLVRDDGRRAFALQAVFAASGENEEEDGRMAKMTRERGIGEEGEREIKEKCSMITLRSSPSTSRGSCSGFTLFALSGCERGQS